MCVCVSVCECVWMRVSVCACVYCLITVCVLWYSSFNKSSFNIIYSKLYYYLILFWSKKITIWLQRTSGNKVIIHSWPDHRLSIRLDEANIINSNYMDLHLINLTSCHRTPSCFITRPWSPSIYQLRVETNLKTSNSLGLWLKRWVPTTTSLLYY